jgi:hypothetical protein
MVFICEDCKIFKSSNVKSFTNHRRSCRKNKKQFTTAGEYNHTGTLKFSQTSSSISKISSKSSAVLNKNCLHSTTSDKSNKEFNVNFSPNSSHGDIHLHVGDHPLDSFYDDSQQSHELVFENKYLQFQRKIISIYSNTRITNFGDYYHNISSSMENKLKLGHTLPIISWDRYSSAFEDIDTKKTYSDDYTIDGAKDVRFIVQRPIFSDSTTNVSAQSVQEFNNFASNLVDLIPLISNIEYELFDSLGENVLEEDSVNDDSSESENDS